MHTTTVAAKASIKDPSAAQNVKEKPAEPFKFEKNDNKRYTGFVKSFSDINGYGFISSPEVKEKYNMDVFVHQHEVAKLTGLAGLPLGTTISFIIVLNPKGQPQARNLRYEYPVEDTMGGQMGGQMMSMGGQMMPMMQMVPMGHPMMPMMPMMCPMPGMPGPAPVQPKAVAPKAPAPKNQFDAAAALMKSQEEYQRHSASPPRRSRSRSRRRSKDTSPNNDRKSKSSKRRRSSVRSRSSRSSDSSSKAADPVELSPEIAEAVKNLPEGMPSLGSKKHSGGDCHVCVFFNKERGCRLGKACDFCHLCDKEKLLERKKLKGTKRRKKNAEDEAGGFNMMNLKPNVQFFPTAANGNPSNFRQPVGYPPYNPQVNPGYFPSTGSMPMQRTMMPSVYGSMMPNSNAGMQNMGMQPMMQQNTMMPNTSMMNMQGMNPSMNMQGGMTMQGMAPSMASMQSTPMNSMQSANMGSSMSSMPGSSMSGIPNNIPSATSMTMTYNQTSPAYQDQNQSQFGQYYKTPSVNYPQPVAQMPMQNSSQMPMQMQYQHQQPMNPMQQQQYQSMA